MGPKWDRIIFDIATETGPRMVRGWGWSHWAVRKLGAEYPVTHLRTGFLVGQMPTLALARRYCERIERLADWDEARAASPENVVARKLLARAGYRVRARLRVVSSVPAEAEERAP